MHLERSNAIIVSANAPQALKRYYSTRTPPAFPQGVFRHRYSDRGYSNEVFRQRYCDRGYSNRRYSDMGYSDRVYLLRVFPQVVPSAHTSPLLLKGGINLGLSNTTRMRKCTLGSETLP